MIHCKMIIFRLLSRIYKKFAFNLGVFQVCYDDAYVMIYLTDDEQCGTVLNWKIKKKKLLAKHFGDVTKEIFSTFWLEKPLNSKKKE